MADVGLRPEEVAAMREQLARLAGLRHLKAAEREAEAAEARRYLYDPVGWINRYLLYQPGQGMTPYQAEIVDQLAKRKRAAVRGPHGLGKTGIASMTVIWFSITREQAGIDWKVLTTASAWRHLTKFLWPEIKKWSRGVNWDELDRAPFNDRTELLDLTLKLKFGAASAVASSRPEFIEGAHADSLLYLLDEAKIIPDERTPRGRSRWPRGCRSVRARHLHPRTTPRPVLRDPPQGTRSRGLVDAPRQA
jgi:hypothetical protein